VIVRWGLEELEGILGDLAIRKPLLVTSSRFAGLELPVVDRFVGVRRHAPTETVAAAVAAAAAADGLVALGGGSAMDTAKAVSAETGLQLVAIPTTYSGAEWTRHFGSRDETRRVKTGGTGANTVAIVYEPRLTLDLPLEETVGTSLNALAHCAEALYVDRHNADADREALAGAPLLDRWVTEVVARPSDLEARTKLLEGAMHAGAALGLSGLALGHAVAQALGGRYGLPHGAMNALSLPPALRFNEPAVPAEVARFGEALGTADPASRVEELAQLGGFERLRQCGVPEDDLPGLARDVVARPGTRANPRPVTVADAEGLLRSIW
jgi:alcohol dehydrogenase class IV